MKTRIYDSQDRFVEIELKNKPIRAIFVVLVCGDEYVNILYDDNEIQAETALKVKTIEERVWRMPFYDNDYIVVGENIKKWLNYKTRYKYKAQARSEFFEAINMIER